MAKFLFSLIIILLVGIGSAHGEYTEHFRRGSEYFYAGRFEQAIAEFEESLRLNPLLDEIDIQLAREAMKYLETIALEEEHLAEEIKMLRAERVARRAAKEKIAELELEERIKLGVEEKERIRRLIEEEERRERLIGIEARKRELERPKLKVRGGIPITYLRFFNLDFEHGDFPARDGRNYPIAIPGTDGDRGERLTFAGFTLMPLEELSFTFEMSQSRTWGELAITRDFIRSTVDQLFPSIILPRTILTIPMPPFPPIRSVILDGIRSYKEILPGEMIMLNGLPLLPRKELVTFLRPMVVDMVTTELVKALPPAKPKPPDLRWRNIGLAYLDADFLGFEAKIGRQHLSMGLPIEVYEVVELIDIGVVQDLIRMVVGHADAVDLSYRTPPIMGLVSPRVRYFGMKLDDADPGVCRVRSDHYYTGGSLGLELSVEGAMDMLGLELPGLEFPEEITIAEAARHLREDRDLRDRVQSDILRLPMAVYVRQSGRKGVWSTIPYLPVIGDRPRWRHYRDGPRHWVRSEEVGGYGWIGAIPIVVPGDRMPFFAAVHKYRSGDDPRTPAISEAFDPLPHDLLFMPLDPAALLPIPIALPEGFDIGTNMRYQLYAAGFRPSENLTLIGLYAELDRARLMPSDNTALDRARIAAGVWRPGTDKDFLQMGGLASIFTWRDIGFTLVGLGIRPEDSLYDAMQDMADEIQIGGRLWTPGSRLLPELLHRSKEWMRILVGMITLAPTPNTSLIMGAGWIDPADHLFNFANAVIYYDAEGALAGMLPFPPGVTLTVDPIERFAAPFFDDPAMVLFMQFAVHF